MPLRRVLPDARIVTGEATSADPEARTVTVATRASEEDGARPLVLHYDHLVVAVGSVSRTLPIPGLAEHGIGFRTVEEAIGLRNHVLSQLDAASSTRDPALRDAALTFVFVGGGFAGVEALGELEDMARHAARHYHNVAEDDLRWVLVEAGERILSEADERVGAYALAALRDRGVDVRLGTRLARADADGVDLTDGTRLGTRTLVWTAGVKAHPILERLRLPRDADGRVPTDASLRALGRPGVWAAGDCAAVPDLDHPAAGAVARGPFPADHTAAAPGGAARPGETGPRRGGSRLGGRRTAATRSAGPGRTPVTGPAAHTTGDPDTPAPDTPICPPSAQHATRQARLLADNLAATLEGRPLRQYRRGQAGSVASLGLHKGVAQVYGVKLTGLPAWLVHRGYHLSRVPTANRKARVLAEWTLAALFQREIVSLGDVEHPRAEFRRAAESDRDRPAERGGTPPASGERPSGGNDSDGSASRRQRSDDGRGG
ncbi:NAD(P)/FAD-dependent oxidoreductase [Allostreptomyces psammosilenae]|uniref:NADH dehydrogenase n=1 Tax=Allostreptomyces psammosilenae TaxID=1892865 RepID=A0A852ZYN3_9ACTN|nr:FAD-dependent oxidoreductase [Allostreptomyces psammosilenae]NYI07493.1 NADH dehydrogenase [Allostreptomyces psammosilenae]